jgi:hypothetical protein
MAGIEQRVNSRKGRERRQQGTSRYGRAAHEPGWSSKTSKFWRRIMVFLGFCEQVLIQLQNWGANIIKFTYIAYKLCDKNCPKKKLKK